MPKRNKKIKIGDLIQLYYDDSIRTGLVTRVDDDGYVGYLDLDDFSQTSDNGAEIVVLASQKKTSEIIFKALAELARARK